MFLTCPQLISGCRSSGGISFQILGPAREKSLSPKLFCIRGTTHVLYSWLIEEDAVRCQQEAGHHSPSTEAPDQIVTCWWYRPVWTALVDGLEASATDVALLWCGMVNEYHSFQAQL